MSNTLMGEANEMSDFQKTREQIIEGVSAYLVAIRQFAPTVDLIVGEIRQFAEEQELDISNQSDQDLNAIAQEVITEIARREKLDKEGYDKGFIEGIEEL